MDNLVYWVWITQAFGSGNNRIWDVVNSFDNIAEAYEALSNGEYSKLTDIEKKSVGRTHISQSEEIIKYCEKKEIKITSFDDQGYPNRLKQIYNPPPILFYIGDLSFIDNEVTITVVGTRHPSPYSINLAKKICDELAKVGVTLVSGFALGIDSMAHQAALKNNGRTVAVLGCGIDFDYPKENSPVKKIIARKGAVISEFFPGTRPNGSNFPLRNRIMSGLSLGTLIVEAGMQSGALITAELALQQGRDIFCIPPADLFDARYSGVIKLIREGAIPTFSHLDIVYEYYENFSHKINSANLYYNYSNINEATSLFDGTDKSAPIKKDIINKEDKSEEIKEKSIPEINYDELTSEQIKIVKLLEKCSLLADEIAVMSDFDVTEVLSLLTELELLGIVESKAGKRYSVNILA